MMPLWQRVYLTVAVGVITWTLGYVVADYARIPRVYHFQHEHRFELRTHVSDPVPSGYVGLWLWAAIGAVFTCVVVYLLLRLRKRPISERWLNLWLAWAITAFALAAGYYSWNNWP